MKYILFAAWIFFFAATPVYLFNSLVLPELNALQQTYSHADEVANRIATGAPE